MNFGLKSGLAAVALLTLCAPAFALNPQPEPPGVVAHHDVNMSVQNSRPTLTAPISNSCGANSGRPNVVAGGSQSAGNMVAHAGATGAALDAGVSAHGDKCAKSAGSMGAAAPVPAPATH